MKEWMDKGTYFHPHDQKEEMQKELGDKTEYKQRG